MGSPRRIGTESSKTRAALLDAAEQLMLEEGYAAATSRRVAAKAGLKPGLVHYYFRTMDDLFIALFRRRAEQAVERDAKALDSPQPLWSLWELARDERTVAMTNELLALANHRKALRAEIAAYGQRLRSSQIDTIAGCLERYGLGKERSTAKTVTVVLSAVARFMTMEEALGISAGHAEAVALVERRLSDFEGERRSADAS